MVHLLKLINPDEYWGPYFIQITLVFYLMSFFCSRISSKISAFYSVMSPQGPLGSDYFPDFICFWRPWHFWVVLVRYFVEHPLIGIFLGFFFLMVLLGLWVFGRKKLEVKYPFFLIILYQECVVSTWSITVDNGSPGWGSVCQVFPL